MKKCYSIIYKGEDYRKHVIRIWAENSKQALADLRKRNDVDVDHVCAIRKGPGWPFVLLLIVLGVVVLIAVSARLAQT